MAASSEVRLDAGSIVFAILVAILEIYVAVDSIRLYRKGRTWATFFMARLGVGSCVFQIVNLTSINLALWPTAIGSRIIWFMTPFGTVANVCLNLWRMRIFAFLMHKAFSNALQVKFLVPSFAGTAFISCFPTFIWIFNSALYESSPSIKSWANVGFIFWMFAYTLLDLFAAAFSLRKVFQVVINGREKHARRCKACLIMMILVDAYSVIEGALMASKAEFPYSRELLSPLYSACMLHVCLTYLYMVSIVKYMIDRDHQIISMGKADTKADTSKSKEPDEDVKQPGSKQSIINTTSTSDETHPEAAPVQTS
jgi:hypothetical protein